MAEGDKLDALLLAVIALLVDDRNHRLTDADVKTELLLDSCGLTNQQIAQVMNKQPDAVRKVISRARGAAK